MTSEITSSIARLFRERFNSKPRVFRAPGRVNLIGEHTDYNDGFVMPAAIDFATFVAAAARNDRMLVIRSENYNDERVFDLDETDPKPMRHWSDYVRGVAVVLERADHRLRGANLLIKGEIPLGAGLSSSAAIEVATALALLNVNRDSLPPLELALLCQRAENDFVGMRCGIMDQFISCHAQAGHALMLDCRSLAFRAVPLPPNVRLVICNTMVKHELASGEYNRRRAECEMGVKLIRRSIPAIHALRDVTMEQIRSLNSRLPASVARRCRHVVSENARVVEAAKALEESNLSRLGRLMTASHASLRDDYKVSCVELDSLVEIASAHQGVFGARMTGGGFGGCTINIVAEDHVEGFVGAVRQEYEIKHFMKPDVYVCTASDGAGEVTPA
ncbi:MAG: galactokinase [Vicinamibacteria bacterium]|nr:galactokinase [Vicinamibacteria bacterium]